MIPTINDRCFLTTTTASATFSKQSAQYLCSINGGYIAALETLTKLNAVINWLRSNHLFFIINKFTSLNLIN
jgi:hypothetical protein